MTARSSASDTWRAYQDGGVRYRCRLMGYRLLCLDAGFSVKIAMEAYPAQSIIALVACGVGLGFIASENQRLTRDGVVYRPITAPGPHLDVGVAYHTDGIAPASQAFLAAARRAGRAMR